MAENYTCAKFLKLDLARKIAGWTDDLSLLPGIFHGDDHVSKALTILVDSISF